jgi:hypothetical protein
VTFEQFAKCPHNLANNRQVRMVANLSLSGCYKPGAMSAETRDFIMLRSAKKNLQQMAFFGLTEYQQETQYLFEKTFHLKFRRDFFKYNHTHSSEVDIYPYQHRQILKLNKLDVELYHYAKSLFFQRLIFALQEDAKVQNGIGGLSLFANNRNMIREHVDYEEGDENDTEDDEEQNKRIAGTTNSIK